MKESLSAQNYAEINVSDDSDSSLSSHLHSRAALKDELTGRVQFDSPGVLPRLGFQSISDVLVQGCFKKLREDNTFQEQYNLLSGIVDGTVRVIGTLEKAMYKPLVRSDGYFILQKRIYEVVYAAQNHHNDRRLPTTDSRGRPHAPVQSSLQVSLFWRQERSDLRSSHFGVPLYKTWLLITGGGHTCHGIKARNTPAGNEHGMEISRRIRDNQGLGTPRSQSCNIRRHSH